MIDLPLWRRSQLQQQRSVTWIDGSVKRLQIKQADTQWLMQAAADDSHKVLTVTTHAENSKDPAAAVRTGCLRFIELAGTGAH